MDLVCILCHEGILAEAQDGGSDQCFLNQCGHVFHSYCMTKWLESANGCPVCRKVVNRRPMLLFVDQSIHQPSSNLASQLTQEFYTLKNQMELQEVILGEFQQEVGRLKKTHTLLRKQLPFHTANRQCLLQEVANYQVRNWDLEQKWTVAQDAVNKANDAVRNERRDLMKKCKTALDQTEASGHHSAHASFENFLMKRELQTVRDENEKLRRELEEVEKLNFQIARAVGGEMETHSSEMKELRKIVEELRNQNATSYEAKEDNRT